MTDRVERRLSRAWPGLAVGVLALLLAGSLGAQEREDRRCRCVDRDGKEIENCHCLRIEPRVLPEIARGLTVERRSQIGVWIDYQPEGDLEGVRIGEVQEGGPADEAGMRTGDVVVSVDGHSVLEPLDDEAQEEDLDDSQPLPVQRFIYLVGALEPDEAVDIVVLRDGARRTLQVTPEEVGGVTLFGLTSPEGRELRILESPEWRMNLDELRERSGDLETRLRESRPWIYRFDTPGRSGEVRVLGDSLAHVEGSFFGRIRRDPCMQLREGDRQVWVLGGDNCVDGAELVELNPELGEYFGTDEGVLVTRVAEDSPLGLRAGDVLLAIGGREVSDVEDVRRILASYTTDEDIRLRVRRKGSEQEVLGRRP